MQPERWHRIDNILQAALALDPAERTAFLDSACEGDESLRDEVISLLSFEQQTLDLIDIPAVEVAAPLLASNQPDLPEGQLIGHYRIISLLGIGGMGEVYLAKDEKLNRRIALKLLPADYTRNKDRLRRFQQEAQAASALNHPNILTIHELGELDGQQFIATEFVEGETLRERMKLGGLNLCEILDVTVQIAGALAAAHKAGIVHRDIKPENIMIRPDSYVKVLDFGLAKLTEQYELTPHAQGAERLDISSGLVMGTVKYMSPEQARGLSVDARTDIFSLGIVLYEMLTGHPPFKGESASDLIKSIVKDEPPPLPKYLPEATADLDGIVIKALRKDKTKRYQTAEELVRDLKSLKQQIEPRAATNVFAFELDRGVVSTEKVDQRVTSGIEYLVSAITQDKPRAAVVLGTIILFTAGLLLATQKLFERNRSSSSLQTMTLRRLTTTGKVTSAAISPDGNYIAYVVNDSGQQSLWVRQVATSSNVRVVGPGQALNSGLTFSPDGNYIYYRVVDLTNTVNTLYRTSVLGRDPQKVMLDIDSPITFSPDGKRVAFIRNNDPVVGESNLLTANEDGTDERLVSTRKLPDEFRGPAWSPDGKGLACAYGIGGGPFSLIEVPVEGGVEKPIGSQQWSRPGKVAWLSDGSALILTAQDQSSAQTQVWQVAYPSGDVRRVTNDLNSYIDVSLTADSGTMAVVQTALQSDIWVAPGTNSGDPRVITSEAGKDDGSQGLAWTPDGKLIYASNASGNLDLWMIDSGTGVPKQLTSNAGQNYEPAVTPDGHYIVFTSDRAGTRNLWRMNVDGSDPLRLTTGRNDHFPRCSPDSKWVVYNSPGTSAPTTLWKVAVDGGAPVQLSDVWALMPSVSPDGKQVACYYFERGETSWAVRTGLLPLDGGPITRVSEHAGFPLRWSPDGSAITYVPAPTGALPTGASNIWAMPVDGGPPKQLTDFKSDQIFWFDWSHDGRLAIARGTTVSDVVLITNFR
jgi:serine/threonine protein kinase